MKESTNGRGFGLKRVVEQFVVRVIPDLQAQSTTAIAFDPHVIGWRSHQHCDGGDRQGNRKAPGTREHPMNVLGNQSYDACRIRACKQPAIEFARFGWVSRRNPARIERLEAIASQNRNQRGPDFGKR